MNVSEFPNKKLSVNISTEEPLAVKFFVVMDISSAELLILFVALQLILGGTNEIYPGTLPEFILKVI